jgi:hypothetical protein
MTRFLIPALALALLALAPSSEVAAQGVTPFAGGGLAMGTGDLGSDTGNGWLAFGGVNLPVGTSGLFLGATAAHARIPYTGDFDEEARVSSVTGDIGYTFGLIANLAAPYVRGGLGLRVETYEPGTLAGTRSTHSEIGFGGGAGLNFDLVSWSAFVGTHVLTGSDAGVWAVFAGVGVPLGGSRR